MLCRRLLVARLRKTNLLALGFGNRSCGNGLDVGSPTPSTISSRASLASALQRQSLLRSAQIMDRREVKRILTERTLKGVVVKLPRGIGYFETSTTAKPLSSIGPLPVSRPAKPIGSGRR